MARRYLGFTADEWDGLPWWQQRLYLEGVDAEFAAAAPNEQQPVPAHTNPMDSDDKLRAMGFTIT